MLFSRTVTAICGLLAATSLVEGADVTTYHFPKTHYPRKNGNNGGMIHGLCVLGAKDVTTTVSPNSSGFKYTNIPNLKDGVPAFSNGNYWTISGIDGYGKEVCEGGTYLQPSTVFGPPPGVDITVEATAINDRTGIFVCAFLEKKMGTLNRQGNWKQPLLNDGFTAFEGKVTYAPGHPGRYTSYCKHFGPKTLSPTLFPSQSPSVSPTTTDLPTTFYAFPTTDYPVAFSEKIHDGGMIHALCVLHARDVTTTVSPNSSGFKYTKIPNLKNGTPAYADNPAWLITGINGHGDEACEGGIYLQPSLTYGPPPGVDITIEATAMNRRTPAILCVFVEHRFVGYNREGNWKQSLIDDGFVPSEGKFTFDPRNPNRFTSYCRGLEEKQQPSVKNLEISSCLEDVQLKKTRGITKYPDSSTPAVNIISQDTSTVTVELKQTWDATIDKYFFRYKDTLFTSLCEDAEGVVPGEIIDTITIQCLLKHPIASLEICLQDTSNNFLRIRDDASISKCCYSDAPEDTPTVCYNLDILCENTCRGQSSSRNLRVKQSSRNGFQSR